MPKECFYSRNTTIYYHHKSPTLVRLAFIERTGGRKGDGFKALKAFCKWADEKGYAITAEAYDTRIIEMNRRLGFQHVETINPKVSIGEIMTREPNFRR